MSTIKIFVSHTPNRDNAVVENKLMTNVIAGSDFQSKPVPFNWVSDNTGDNISSKNKSYCELTTQYWAWKNVDADYYGFFHYRRYLSFNPKYLKTDRWGNIILEYLNDSSLKKLHINEDEMERLINKYDIIMASGVNVRHLGAKNVGEHYKLAPELHYTDYQSMLTVIKEKYNYLYTAAVNYTNGGLYYPCNMFIMKKEIFMDYSNILFGILFELEKKLDMSLYSTEGFRTPGHLGERIAGIYYTYLLSKEKYETKELQISVFQDTTPMKQLSPPTGEKEVIPIVLAANDYYAPYLSTCIQSILKHSSNQFQYDIVVFNKDITLKNQNIIRNQVESFTNVRLTYINVGAYLSEYKLSAKEHITIETFYRFLILDIMRDYPKVIYLDCDLIVCDDLANLFQISLDDYYIGACLDPDFIGQINMPQSNTKKYALEIMKLNNPYQYFQAGVLLLNVTAMNLQVSVTELLDMAATGIYKYSDQDILNIVCAGKVKYLDMAWNMITDCNGERISKVIKSSPREIQDMYFHAHAAPKIIHYAGFLKPWQNPWEDLAHYFWATAKLTPFYEQIILRTCEKIIENRIYNNKFHPIRRLKIRILSCSVILLPYQSRRREVIKKIYKNIKGER